MPRETRVRLRARRQHIMPAAGGALHRRSCSAPQVVRRAPSAPTLCCRRLPPSPRVDSTERWFRDCQLTGFRFSRTRRTSNRCELLDTSSLFLSPNVVSCSGKSGMNFPERGTAGWGSGKSEKVSGCSKLPPKTSRAHLVPLKFPGENFPFTIRNSLMRSRGSTICVAVSRPPHASCRQFTIDFPTLCTSPLVR